MVSWKNVFLKKNESPGRVMSNIHSYLLRVLVLILAVSNINGCDGSGVSETERFLYTSSNDPAGNNIIVLSIGQYGGLTEVGTVPTGGPGDADEGDFDGQHSLFIIPGTNYLLAVNAGDSVGQPGIPDGNGSVSVFEINGETGLLTRVDQNPLTPEVDNMDSGGVRPVSIGAAVIDGKTWVLAGNQYHNPRYGGNSRADLTNTRPGDPTDMIAVTPLRNVTAFEFNDGILSAPLTVAVYEDGLNGGPSQVAFSPDGAKVAVSIWGVPQFGGDAIANAAVQMPSRIYVYDTAVSETGLELANERFFEMTGVAGSIGFSWGRDGENVFVANANLAQIPESLEDFGVTVISTGEDPELVNNAGIPGAGDAACWTLLTSDGERLYIASFAGNIVSYFGVSPEGGLTLRQSFTREDVPPLDTKDMYLTRNGEYFYVSGPLMSHSIAIYDVDAEGLLTEAPFSPFEVPSARPGGVNVSPESQAFLGLVGY